MGNEESQQMGMAPGGAGGAAGGAGYAGHPGYPQSNDPRHFSSQGTFRNPQQQNNSPFNFPPPGNNSAASFPGMRQVSPFNSTTPQPQRFSGPSGAGPRFSAPFSGTGPPGYKPPTARMDVDLTGLSAEEQRKIAEVMERAQALQDIESNPTSVFGSRPPAVKPFNQGSSGNLDPSKTSSAFGKSPFAPIPLKEQNISPTVTQKPTMHMQQQSSSTFSPVSAKPTVLNTQTQNWSPPLSSAQFSDSNVAPNSRHKQLLTEQERSLSRSFSSEEQLFSPDDHEPEKNRPPPALPDKWQEEPHQTGSAPPNTIIPANATFPRHPGTAAAKVERCPLCRETELKIVTVHGKAQPLIGQLCARCSLIVCSKCGKVKKSFDQKNAYWMCTQCVNIPWTPPKELDKADFGDPLSGAMKRHDNSFVAPLTHLVAADNSIQSDAVRSSPALFFDDEPSYANARSALLSTTNEPPQYDHHYNDEEEEEEEEEVGWEKRFVPETAYQSTGSKTVKSPGKMLPIFQPLPDAVSSLKQSTIVETTSEQSESFADEYNRAHPQEASSSPFPGGENRRSSEQKQQKQEQQFYDELEDRPQAPPLQQPQQLHHHPQWQLIHEELPSHSNSSSDLFPPQMPTFSASQESLYEIQEEETSDYGSQIQAACSDIASLSNSTSGGDFGGGGGQQQRNWLPQAASHNSWAQSESPHHHSGQINANASQLQDNGASLRRSNLVENFRSMPQPSDGASGDASGQQQRHHQLNVSSNNKPHAGDSTPRGSSQPNVQLYQPQKGQLSGHVQPEQRHFSTFHGAKQSVLQKTGQEASGSVRAQVERLEQFGISEHQQSGQTMQQSERRRSLPGDKTMERQQESSQQPQRSPSNSNAATGSGQHHAHPPMRETTLLHEPSQPHPHPQQQPQSGTPRYHPSANSSSSSHEVQQLSNPNFSGDDRKPLHPHQQQQQPVESSSSASTSGLRRIIHQGSRDDLPRVNRPGAHGPSVDTVAAVAEIDDCDSALESSATDGNAADFDTISQCSGNSAALFPPESAGSMRTVHGDGTQSMERRQKRRLPCLPKDDQDGASITPEERERQKKELKRRLSGNLLRLTTTTGTATDAEPPSVDGVLRNGGGGGGGGGGDGVVSGGRDWQGEATAGGPGKGPASKVVKRKKHKHLPQTPHDHDAPKVQQLKQQLRMLAARKAGGLFEDDKSFGSLPNNPLNRFKSISGDEASSSTEYLTDSTFKSKPQAQAQAQAQAAATSGGGQARSHYASDPALFRSILDQYHRVAEQEKRERELAEGDRRNGDLQNGDRQNGYLFGSSQSVQLQTHSDPEIQDIVARLQQFNRDLADTKELFRSTSNSLERRHVPRWKSDADLANRRWRRQSDKGQRSRPQHPDDPYFLREMNGYASLPYGNDGGRDKRFQADLQQRIGRNGMWRNEENFEESFHGRRLAQKMGNRFQPEFDEMYNGQQFYDGGLGLREMTFDQQGYPMFDGQNGFNDMDGEFGYADPWCNSLPQTILPDPTFLLPLPYLEATQYPGFNPMTDIDNEDLSLYEPFDDPNFLPMGAGVVLAHHLNQQQQLQQKQSSLANGVTSRRHYAPSVHPADFGGGGSQSPRGQMTSALDAPLFDSRVSCSDEPGKVADLNGHFEDEKENFSDTGSDGLNANEKLSRSVSAMSKKHKKEDLRPKYNFATKRILLTRDPKDRSVSGNGLGVRIAGGKLIPNTNTLGAFVSKIWDNGIMATLNEVKEVQEILDAGNGEVDMLLRCDYNVRHLEAELEETRDRQLSAAQAERARLRDLDSGDRSPLPTRSLFSGRKQDQAKQDDTDEVVYRPSNQLAPPSPGGMPRKKSTSSGHTPVTGDLLLRMTYERCTLTLQVLKARSLKAADKSGFSDPYCKLNLVPARANEYKFRTKCITQTLNPEWKETFSFQSIDPNEIHHKSIEITVWDWDRLSADDFLGEVIVDLTDPIHLDGTKRWYPLGERRPGAVDE
ncbi:putative Protein piccolo [Hypsibius exemplaris]|uniref:C2 domain-containing protein n=1 Tax=Hypsibius exemplaris TaxID=2072580 RepID=A0A1W0WH28_HYPEX|nr:putative Protein piccolo [Hypsibius exemplaris]